MELNHRPFPFLSVRNCSFAELLTHKMVHHEGNAPSESEDAGFTDQPVYFSGLMVEKVTQIQALDRSSLRYFRCAAWERSTVFMDWVKVGSLWHDQTDNSNTK